MSNLQSELSDDEKEALAEKAVLKKNLLHHRIELSYLTNSSDKSNDGGYSYPSLSRRVRVEATYRRYEAWEKKMGKMHWVSRNVFVPPYEYIEITISNRTRTWKGKILYDTHNISRVKATRDDTWELDFFMDTVQRAVQYPKLVPGITFVLTEKTQEDSPKHTVMTLEIREKTGGRTVVYIQPCVLTEAVTIGEPVTEKGVLSPADFVKQVYAINLEKLCRLCRTGKATLARGLIQEGFTDVHAFAGEKQDQWCALQWAAYSGQRKVVLWLLDELKVDPMSRSHDGWTAMHCASQQGHFEVCKLLYERGASLHDETTSRGGGLTPIILMMENKHVGMLRYFMSEHSKFAQDCYRAQGVRNKEMPQDMYLTLKPLPPEVMKEIRRAKRIKRAQLEEKREELARLQRAETGVPEPLPVKSKSGKFTAKSSGGGKKSSSSPSPSPSRQGTASRPESVSPAASATSQASRTSPSPPKRK